MSVEEAIKWFGGGMVALATFVQITPIKINPWSAILKWIGQSIFGETMKKIDDRFDKIDKRIDGVEKSIEAQKDTFQERIKSEDEKEAVNIRYRILRFGDECAHGMKHSEEMFNQALEDISHYLDYCDTHAGFKNKKAEVTIKIIMADYQKRKQNNDFL